MRILLIVNEFPPEQLRGTAMSTAALAEALAENGWQVHVVVTRRDTASGEEGVGKVSVHRLSTIPVPYTRTIQRLLGVLQIVRRVRPHVVQGQAASSGLLAALAGRLYGIPSVTYLQGMDVIESGPMRRFLEIRSAVKYATRTIAVNDALAERVAPYTRGNVEVIPHGYRPEPIPPEMLAVARRRLGSSGPHVLFVGYLEPDKGINYLFSAVALLSKDLTGLQLHVVGDGPLRHELEALAERENIAARVTFYGNLPHAEVLALMREADVFVLPSVQEPFGVVVVEALNESCPVVVTTACGSSDAIRYAGGGLVVPPRDATSLAGALTDILLHPERRAEMAQAARQAGQAFRWDRHVKRFERLYGEVLSEKT